MYPEDRLGYIMGTFKGSGWRILGASRLPWAATEVLASHLNRIRPSMTRCWLPSSDNNTSTRARGFMPA
jgi:hypothetical protein